MYQQNEIILQLMEGTQREEPSLVVHYQWRSSWESSSAHSCQPSAWETWDRHEGITPISAALVNHSLLPVQPLPSSLMRLSLHEQAREEAGGSQGSGTWLGAALRIRSDSDQDAE